MNILVFSWRDIKHPLAGGAEQVDHEHHKGWITGQHNVTLFSSYFKGAKKTENIDGINIIRMGNQILGVHLAAFYWYFFVRHDRFDLVVDEFHGIPFFTPFYVRRPIISVLQEVAREVWLKNDLSFPMNIIIGYIGYFFEPYIFLLYKKIPFMVGSNSAKTELSRMRIPRKNIKVISHGVILDLPKNKLPKEKVKTVIFLGALAKDKGIEDAIKAFRILNDKGNFQFWIIGKGEKDYLEKLKKLCRNEGINKKTKFWGFVSQKEKFNLLSKAHIMINPSLLEGFGLVNIEANSCGIPVVAYNSPGLTDSVKDGVSGIICKENTPENLAKNVIFLMKDKEKYKNMQKNAVKWCKKFNWDSSRKLSLDLIEEMVLK